MNQNISVSSFTYHGLEIINQNRQNFDTNWTTVNQRRWSANYGTSPHICQCLWKLVTEKDPLPRGGSFYHLLWTLLFLKTYMTELVMSGMIGVDEQTYRKWLWIILPRIGNLKERIVSCYIIVLLFTCH